MKAPDVPLHILPVIVLAQFAGTSLWFAGNAIAGELSNAFHLPVGVIGSLTSSVQLGFILGTLCFAIVSLADRYSPRMIFMLCALLGALSNVLIVFASTGYISILVYRFMTGFFLAGIYPVGMKIASDWYHGKLGKALGFLVGALVLGTAFPHLFKSVTGSMSWEKVLIGISIIAALGGILLFTTLKEGPHREVGVKFNISAIVQVFKVRDFRFSVFGYFGHMWELYAFWAFVPVIISAYMQLNPGYHVNLAFWSFLVIGAGFIGCVFGGFISVRTGSAKVAFVQLLFSGACCLFAPLIFKLEPVFFFTILLFWGIAVVGDSPQFSALSARTAPKKWIGTALTIATSIGFAITIFSIQLLEYLTTQLSVQYALICLVPGPVLGLISILPLCRKKL